jgi:hypothetical protein
MSENPRTSIRDLATERTESRRKKAFHYFHENLQIITASRRTIEAERKTGDFYPSSRRPINEKPVAGNAPLGRPKKSE